MLKLLWTGEYDESWAKKFSEYAEVTRKGLGLTGNIINKMDEDELIEALQGIDVLLVGYDKVTERVLKSCPDLKLILSVRDGPEENIDLEACSMLGIPVMSSAGRCTVSVAEYTFLLMMLLARPVVSLTNRMRESGWTKDNRKELRDISETSTELYEKTLGIVGAGRNGQHLAALARGFSMRVVAYDPYADEEKMKALGIELMPLEEVMKEADYISVLARLTPETEGLVGRKEIACMKPTACLINTGRAKLIDNDALLDALENNEISAAALDVFEQEPVGNDSRIYTIPEDKLLITPHGAGVTRERVHHQSKSLYIQFVDFIKGKKPSGLCTKSVFEESAFKERGGKLIAEQ